MDIKQYRGTYCNEITAYEIVQVSTTGRPQLWINIFPDPTDTVSLTVKKWWPLLKLAGPGPTQIHYADENASLQSKKLK